MREALLRNECYGDIVDNLQLLQEIKSSQKFPGYSHLYELMHKKNSQNLILLMDGLIEEKLEKLDPEVSTIAEINSIQKVKSTSIYTKIFHSRHWGPVLSFFGATGTLFGVSKALLELIGITMLMGSATSLLLLIATVAIVISGTFATKHWLFNKKSEERKEWLEKFENVEMNA